MDEQRRFAELTQSEYNLLNKKEKISFLSSFRFIDHDEISRAKTVVQFKKLYEKYEREIRETQQRNLQILLSEPTHSTIPEEFNSPSLISPKAKNFSSKRQSNRGNVFASPSSMESQVIPSPTITSPNNDLNLRKSPVREIINEGRNSPHRQGSLSPLRNNNNGEGGIMNSILTQIINGSDDGIMEGLERGSEEDNDDLGDDDDGNGDTSYIQGRNPESEAAFWWSRNKPRSDDNDFNNNSNDNIDDDDDDENDDDGGGVRKKNTKKTIKRKKRTTKTKRRSKCNTTFLFILFIIFIFSAAIYYVYFLDDGAERERRGMQHTIQSFIYDFNYELRKAKGRYDCRETTSYMYSLSETQEFMKEKGYSISLTGLLEYLRDADPAIKKLLKSEINNHTYYFYQDENPIVPLYCQLYIYQFRIALTFVFVASLLFYVLFSSFIRSKMREAHIEVVGGRISQTLLRDSLFGSYPIALRNALLAVIVRRMESNPLYRSFGSVEGGVLQTFWELNDDYED